MYILNILCVDNLKTFGFNHSVLSRKNLTESILDSMSKIPSERVWVVQWSHKLTYANQLWKNRVYAWKCIPGGKHLLKLEGGIKILFVEKRGINGCWVRHLKIHLVLFWALQAVNEPFLTQLAVLGPPVKVALLCRQLQRVDPWGAAEFVWFSYHQAPGVVCLFTNMWYMCLDLCF